MRWRGGGGGMGRLPGVGLWPPLGKWSAALVSWSVREWRAPPGAPPPPSAPALYFRRPNFHKEFTSNSISMREKYRTKSMDVSSSKADLFCVQFWPRDSPLLYNILGRRDDETRKSRGCETYTRGGKSDY